MTSGEVFSKVRDITILMMTREEKIKELTGAVLVTDPAEIERYAFLWTIIFN